MSPIAQRIFDNLTTAVLWFDRDLRLQAINLAAESLLEISFKQARGLPALALFLEPDKLPRAMARSQRDNVVTTEYGITLDLALGRRITVDYTLTPVADAGEAEGAREMLVEMARMDQWLRLSREENLIMQQQTTQHVISSLAHEMKNPLGGLRGAAQLLARQLADTPELREYTEIIVHEADRLRNLLDRILGPRELPVMTPFNIHETLCRAGRLITADTPDEIQVLTDFDPSIPDVTGDADQIYQAILNMVCNAAQALRDQENRTTPGQIVLRTRVRRRMTLGSKLHKLVLQIDICDNGPGIPSEIRDRVFYPLITGRPGGTGLGLSIAQGYIYRHGGLITCNSEPGETVFTLWLPLPDAKLPRL